MPLTLFGKQIGFEKKLSVVCGFSVHFSCFTPLMYMRADFGHDEACRAKWFFCDVSYLPPPPPMIMTMMRMMMIMIPEPMKVSIKGCRFPSRIRYGKENGSKAVPIPNI